MKVLFLTLIDFSTVDEKNIYTDLLREFINEGHELYIISPTEKRKNEITKVVTDKNVKILKLQIGNIQKTGLIEKGISLITLESKFKFAIKKYFKNIKFDLILYSTPPITLYKSVKYVKKRDKAKTYLLLKDIFPQNALDLGILKDSGFRYLIYKYFKIKEKLLYKTSDYIGCMSNANVKYILENNNWLYKKVVEVCPNSIEPIDIEISYNKKKKIRQKYKLPLNKTIFIYGGNLGKPQGIDFLIECIKYNEINTRSFILIVGSGTEYQRLKEYFDREKPQNAKLLAQMHKKEYEMLANSCDVGLIFLDKRFTIPNFPSRVLSYMQASMPVLAATDINTDIGDVICSGNFGYWCESNDVIKFNKLVNKLCNEELRVELGKNARQYLENNYTSRHSYEIIMKHFNRKEDYLCLKGKHY